jgi:alpha-mannosidase
MLGSQTHSEICRKHIEPTQKFHFWVMNDRWGTNYRGYQDGLIEFRYAPHPHAGYQPAAASHFAMGMSEPLFLQPGRSDPQGRCNSPDRAAACASPRMQKKCRRQCVDCPAFWRHRRNCRTILTWTDGTPIKIWRSDLRERPLERLGTQV